MIRSISQHLFLFPVQCNRERFQAWLGVTNQLSSEGEKYDIVEIIQVGIIDEKY